MKRLFSIGVCLFCCYTCLSQIDFMGRDPRGMVEVGFSFLNINPRIQSSGMADIGVVAASIYGDAGLGQNPALLVNTPYGLTAYLSSSSWLRAWGIPEIYLADWGVILRKNDKHSFAYKGRWFSVGDIYVFSSGKTYTWFIQQQLRYAYKINSELSIGLGLGYVGGRDYEYRTPIESHLLTGDLGLSYRKTLDLLNDQAISWSLGLSVSHLGPKGNYRSERYRDFLPTNLKAGGLLTWEMHEIQGKKWAFDFAYQFEKYLVPTAGPDSDASAFGGIWRSFGDAPGGFSEEWTEIIHQVGGEIRQERIGIFSMWAFRTGLFYEHPQKGNRRYLSFGISGSLYGFRMDGAYYLPLQENHPLQNTWRVGLVYAFGKRTSDA